MARIKGYSEYRSMIAEKARKLAQQGFSYREIAQALSISRQTAYNYVHLTKPLSTSVTVNHIDTEKKEE